MAFRKIRLEEKRLAEIGNRFIVPAHRRIGEPAVEVPVVPIGPYLYRCAVIGDGLLVIPLLAVGDAAIAVSGRQSRLQRNCVAKIENRIVIPVGLEIFRTAIMIS